MAVTVEERIEQLEAAREAVSPADNMAEAGRKVLLSELVKMLSHEDGSRAGDDPEEVHDMRVAIRKMRSIFRLLKPYFKAKDASDYNRALQRIAWVLGEVRDLDVMLANLRAYQSTLEPDAQADLQTAIDELESQLKHARKDLLSMLDGKPYRRFLKEYSRFVAHPIKDAKGVNGSIMPTQVRHLLPTMISERLGAVLAYDNVLETADDSTLHALRIEFKRLRYIVSLFEDLLGSGIDDFIDELKIIQDSLGGMNDVVAARARLDDLDEDVQSEALSAYLASLEANSADLRAHFAERWARFNTRKVQQKLSSAVLALR